MKDEKKNTKFLKVKETYSGEFKDEKKHGRGILIDDNFEYWEEFWYEDDIDYSLDAVDGLVRTDKWKVEQYNRNRAPEDQVHSYYMLQEILKDKSNEI